MAPKFFQKMLKSQQKVFRISDVESMQVGVAEAQNLLKRIITGDETWMIPL